MTVDAVTGEPHRTIPDGIDPSTIDSAYVVVPWYCPEYGHLVAETVVEVVQHRVKTVMVGYSPVRVTAADEDGIPFYGMTRRALRGELERRSPRRLGLGATGKMVRPTMERKQDHGPITLNVFDGLCRRCPQRVRFRIADPWRKR